MNTVKNFTIIHLQLNYIEVLEAVILLVIYLKYVFKIKRNSKDLNVTVFNMITGINESET